MTALVLIPVPLLVVVPGGGNDGGGSSGGGATSEEPLGAAIDGGGGKLSSVLLTLLSPSDEDPIDDESVSLPPLLADKLSRLTLGGDILGNGGTGGGGMVDPL